MFQIYIYTFFSRQDLVAETRKGYSSVFEYRHKAKALSCQERCSLLVEIQPSIREEYQPLSLSLFHSSSLHPSLIFHSALGLGGRAIAGCEFEAGELPSRVCDRFPLRFARRFRRSQSAKSKA